MDFEQGAAAAREAKSPICGQCIDAVSRRAVSGLEAGVQSALFRSVFIIFN